MSARKTNFKNVLMPGYLPFKLYTTCQLVSGASRSTICDLQRNRVHTIPLILHDILVEFDGQTIDTVMRHYANEYDEIIQEYFDFLEQEEIIFFTQTPELFPPLDLQWHSPTEIQTCIIDLGEHSDYNFDGVISSLDKLDCQFLELRSFYPFSPEKYEAILNLCEYTTITSVNLLIQNNSLIEAGQWYALADRFARITGIVVHSSAYSNTGFSPRFCIPVEFIQQSVTSEKCCGIISESRFLATMDVFTESQLRNTCLNRKISIDVSGNIKNCPSMQLSFGNIQTTTLEQIIVHPEYKHAWNLKKDDITICKDCEFRHVCTDCRAYLEDPDDMLSKPLKCGYNPYNCEWESWSTHPMKQHGISKYQLQDILSQNTFISNPL